MKQFNLVRNEKKNLTKPSKISKFKKATAKYSVIE